jgi:hypothetical protein
MISRNDLAQPDTRLASGILLAWKRVIIGGWTTVQNSAIIDFLGQPGDCKAELILEMLGTSLNVLSQPRIRQD